MLHLYTGEGKGKTTAAIGLAVRFLGHQKSVCLVQFLKSGQSGELKILDTLPGFHRYPFLHHFGFYRSLNAIQQEQLRQEIGQAMEFVASKSQDPACDLLILDEMMAVLRYNLYPLPKLLKILKNRPPHLELVLTGRDVPWEIQEMADYFSEIQAKRHPYQRGIGAREAVEY